MRDADTYTPGPWAISNKDSDPSEGTWMKGVTIYSEPTGKRIADTCWLNSSHDKNARLITAAPDMLVALKETLSCLEALGADGWNDAPHLRSITRAAIARAERSPGAKIATPATVAELDAILNSEDDRPITINPDGSISLR